jgi:Peptidase family M28
MASIRRLLEEVDEERLRTSLFYLSRDPLPYRKLNYALPGHSRSTLEEADAWLEAQLQSWGYQVGREGCAVRAFGYDPEKPHRHRYTAPPPDAPVYTAFNLYAERIGEQAPHEILLVLAHKDSQSWIDSPGAYDNGAGTVAVLEMARVLSAYPAQRTIRFLFCNEEHTPWTSVLAAENARRRGDNLMAIFNVDSVGGKPDEAIAAGQKTNVTLYTQPGGKRLADLMAEVNERYRIGLIQSSHQRSRPGDDDGSFINAGYGCAVANLGSWPYADAAYHLPEDIPERVDLVNVRMAAQATLAAVLTLDQLP